MKTLIAVMAHNEPAIFNHLLPQWEKHGHPMVIYSPRDSVPQTSHNVWAFGERSHHDSEANRRFKNLLTQLALTEFDRYVIFEYDAVCLSDVLPIFQVKSDKPEVLCGNVFRDDRPDRPYRGTTFIHPPLIIPKAIIGYLNASLSTLDDDCEGGFWDRMLGLAVEQRGIPLLNFFDHGLGFSRNTIEQHELGEAIQAVEQGAIFVHGIKRWSTFSALRDAYNRSEKRCGLYVPL